MKLESVASGFGGNPEGEKERMKGGKEQMSKAGELLGESRKYSSASTEEDQAIEEGGWGRRKKTKGRGPRKCFWEWGAVHAGCAS